MTQGSERSDFRITDILAHRLRLPYKKAVTFKSVTQDSAEYVLLRLVCANGVEGIAESVCRPEFSGEDAQSLVYLLTSLLKPKLLGADPLHHAAVLTSLDRFKGCQTAKALIDVALWDLRGKLLNQPVWRLLGGGPANSIPLTWVAHGNTAEAMTTESVEMIERGFQGVKLKAWRRSRDDVSTVAAVRERIGDKPLIYVDSNGAYNETEARTILPQLAEHNVSFVEDPCIFSSMARMRSMAEHLPIALLGDEFCTSLTAVQQHVEAGAVGAVSIKLRRSGFSESMKIAHLCEAARLPAVIGTDSESRIGALSRGHLRMSIASLAAWPMETHFFEKLADDVFQGDFNADDGRLRVTDAPGFGASIDREKLAKYVF